MAATETKHIEHHARTRIGIDGRNLQRDRRGDGRYVYELCRQLDVCLPEAIFHVYSSTPVEMPVHSDRWLLRSDRPPFSMLPPLCWLKVRGWYFCRQDDLDVFWGTNVFLPFLPKTVRKIVTVHDLCLKILPESFPLAHLWVNRLFFFRDIRKADMLLSNSRSTSRRVRQLVGYRPVVVCPAVTEAFSPQNEEDVRACLAHYGITGPYLLNIAVWEPRKNLELLVRAFVTMKDSGWLPKHKLVLVGKRGWCSRSIASAVDVNRSKGIIPLGYVPNRHLPSLYSGADVFVFPSLHEGFGIPVLEARACGTRVVATDIPELREAGGSQTVYIKPTEEGIVEGVLAALQKTDASLQRDQLPTWREGAQRLADAMMPQSMACPHPQGAFHHV